MPPTGRSWSPTAIAADRALPVMSWGRQETPTCRATSGRICREIGNAGREDEWLFNYVYDARVYNPETVMPPWGTHGLFNDAGNQRHRRVPEDPEGAGSVSQPSWTIQRKRPAPVETRDNLDDLLNPGMWTVERAQTLWKTNGPERFVMHDLSRRRQGLQELGGRDAEMGTAARQGARRRGIRLSATPRRRPARTG